MKDRPVRPSGWHPPNMIPVVKLKDQNYICRWVRIYIHASEEDKYTVRDRARRGWIPVKHDDIETWDGRLPIPEPNSNGLIETHGVALMMASVSFTSEDVKYFESQAADATTAAENEFANMDGCDPRVPKMMYLDKKVIIGREPTDEELDIPFYW